MNIVYRYTIMISSITAVVVTGAFYLTFGGQLIMPSSNKQLAIHPGEAVATISADHIITEKINSLSKHLESLAEEMAQLRQQQEEAVLHPATDLAAKSRRVISNTIPLDETVQAESMAVQMEQQLQSEMIDEPWSSLVIQTFNDNLATLGDTDIELVDGYCASTMCRIELRHPGESPVPLPLLLGRNDTLSNSQGFYRHLDDGNGNQRTVLYLSRDGFTLPDLSAQPY